MTELYTIHFPTDYSPNNKKEFKQNLFKFITILEEHVPTFIDFVGGWAVEKVPISVTPEESTVFLACRGWQFVEAHLAFRDAQLFEDNKYLLEHAKDLKHIHMVHVSSTKVDNDGRF
jgi:hypothetical protein